MASKQKVQVQKSVPAEGVPVNKVYHYIPEYFVRPDHPISVWLIGLGGTGSLMLTKLAQVNAALRGTGHAGLHVQAWDPDTVSESNIGRQGFLPSDIGLNKAQVLIARVNRAFGLNWMAWPEAFRKNYPTKRAFASDKCANIIITCVDSVRSRRSINKIINDKFDHVSYTVHSSEDRAYWMDLGNSREKGQVILGTLRSIRQPNEDCQRKLETVFDMYPDMEKYEEPNQPSCSMAEALLKQDLLINSMMATWGAKLLWDMFRKIRINYRGVYINLENYTVNPIPITKPDPGK